MRCRAIILLPLLLLGACAEAGAPCFTSLDCLDNELCVDGRCRLSCKGDDDCFDEDVCRHGYCQAATVEADAGVIDAAGYERLDQDASRPDTSTPDSSQSDTARPDTATVDSSLPDTAPPDTSTPDSSLPDNVLPDILAPVDSAELDAYTPPCNGPAPSPELCDPDDPALRACYSFDQDLVAVADDIRDSSQYANHGTSSDVTHAGGVQSLAASFTGLLGSRISVVDSASLDVTGALTIEAWIYARSLPDTGRVCIVDNDSQYGLFIFDTGEFRCSASAEYLYAGVAATGTWTHLACIVDGDGTRMYQDGTLAGTRVTSGTIATASTNPMHIGANSPSADNFDGLIDSLRIWQESRSEDEICWAAQR